MKSVATILKNGGIGVLASDTLYGIVGSALNEKTVDRIYKLKKRSPEKPFIILISDISDLNLFNIKVDNELQNRLAEYWPGKVSVILPCKDEKFEYLHRGTQTLAFRLPAKKTLRQLLIKTGPLVAPSANPEGLAPAKNLNHARSYFKDRLDFYTKGITTNKASKIVLIDGNKVREIRN